MVKVITYGTYDLLHYGHIRLLERAKALGDYLIVGVTADGFDLNRGKINVQQSLMQRIESVRATGLVDEIIVEEYEGQKIDDILRLGVDIFAIGSDWEGKFDYLNDYCKVVYLERTKGVSSSDIRSEKKQLRLALVGDEQHFLSRYEKESNYVNGIEIAGKFSSDSDFDSILNKSDAIYLISKPQDHYLQIKKALENNKHVLCESPIATKTEQWKELTQIAQKKRLVLMDATRTAYSTAYHRLLLLVKSGAIGKVVSVDASCTALRYSSSEGFDFKNAWNSICGWGPTALLPIFQILGTNYVSKQITSHIVDQESRFDTFSKVVFIYPSAVASIKVGKGVKTEGELVISGTDGYIYVPAPWWKTEYFEVRREDTSQNKRYFYQLDGEGIRYELVSFLNAIEGEKAYSYISPDVSLSIAKIIDDYYSSVDFINI